jgi:circadian clock protein KaiC
MRNRPQDPHILEQERASTGILGLDYILGGGLPTNHRYLIEGPSGAGKTTTAIACVRAGRSAAW